MTPEEEEDALTEALDELGRFAVWYHHSTGGWEATISLGGVIVSGVASFTRLAALRNLLYWVHIRAGMERQPWEIDRPLTIDELLAQMPQTKANLAAKALGAKE